MPARLIVNADDFGLTRGVNTAVAELHSAGALTSATLMATGPAFDDAARLARLHPRLSVGCHVVLTDGAPVLPPEQIPSLIGADGRSFRSSLKDFLRAALAGRLRPDHITDEATAQIRTLQRAGITVTHLDTHKHTHILPQIAGPLLRAAEATNVGAIRNPFECPWSLRLGYTRPARLFAVALSSVLRGRFFAQPAIHSGRVVTTRGTIGISATGLLDEKILRAIIASIPDGTWELVCHPGYNDADLDRVQTRLRSTRDVERNALLAVLAHNPQTSPQRKLPELIDYKRLLPSDQRPVTERPDPFAGTPSRPDQEQASV